MMNTLPLRHRPPQRRKQRAGFSLIELLVAMAIGLVVTLAITTVLMKNEGLQRTSTAVNDAVQTGAFSSLSIDQLVRSAGSGFAQFRPGLGCKLNASTAGPAQVLPPLTALPAPFANIGTSTVPVQLAPVVIVDGGQVSGVEQPDQLIVMAGSHGFSEVALGMKPGSAKGGATGAVRVVSTLGMRPDDLVLIADMEPGVGCMVQQVSAATGSDISLSGDRYDEAGADINLTTFNSLLTPTIMPIGSVSAANPNPPSFNAYGVSDQKQLVSYDLLSPSGTAVVPLAEGVVSMQALYGIGVATAPVGGAAVVATTLTWEIPTGSTYGASTSGLLSGSKTNKDTFSKIQAVRVALVVRSALPEKEDVSPPTIVLFPDLAADSKSVTYTVGADGSEARKFRYRVIDTVIPIRNM